MISVKSFKHFAGVICKWLKHTPWFTEIPKRETVGINTLRTTELLSMCVTALHVMQGTNVIKILLKKTLRYLGSYIINTRTLYI